MSKGYVAKSSIIVNAPFNTVWEALTKPDIISKYMFGTKVETDWAVGSPIFFRGVWQGRSYEDKGSILRLERHRLLEYSHFSPLAGLPDKPENYHTVTIHLTGNDGAVIVSLEQDNNSTEQAKKHSEENWGLMLKGLKETAEIG